MWTVYAKSQALGKTPSEYLGVAAYTERVYGYNVWWTCYQVDAAIVGAGRYVESLLMDMDDEGNRKLTLEQILGVEPIAPPETKDNEQSALPAPGLAMLARGRSKPPQPAT